MVLSTLQLILIIFLSHSMSYTIILPTTMFVIEHINPILFRIRVKI